MEAVKIKQFLNGSGYGSGSGSGSGYGSGSGSDSGYGYGYGYGDGSGIKLQTHAGSTVHYIDTLPCVIRSIKRDVALVDVINVDDFGYTPMFVAKHGGLFGHGKTIEEALSAAQEKWAETRSIEERMEEFKSTFKKNVKYDANLFYKWHSILTGSCQSGKDFWIKQQGVDLSKPMSVKEFFELTKNAYGGETIRRLMEDYQ